ncbi:hypothetical protein [Rhodoferax sp.]|uniref:hypothetical protein n=1 Tax=Rhodoferax sp. TaxID=50421 RepID=UPI00260E2950|nr:hypothetical protein [Rhodoferax sp.]MDD5479458.1 hypothetical protein [Rhodoferax sp.]
MRLVKTDKAREELTGSLRRVGRRERNLLILADGQKTIQDFEIIFKDEARLMADSLIREGYLTCIRLTQSQSPPKPTLKPTPESLHQTNADTFEGKRSLATTRMFLFDMCERMFSRRAPEQAQMFRDAFRKARDRESMLAAARDMLQAVELVAGAERADAIGQRIAMLLPVEVDDEAFALSTLHA